MPPPKDLYVILGVKDSAGDDEIKKAYRELAKKFHPDRTGGDKAKETRFKELSAAYDVLSDPKKRAQYDAAKRGDFQGFPGASGAGRGGAGAGFPGGAAGTGNLEDLLSQMFGGGMPGGAGRGPGGSRRVIFEQDLGGRGRGAGRRPPVQFFDDDEVAAGPAPYVEQVLRTPAGDEFVRKGNDLFIDVPLAIDEAVLGAKVEVPTLDGRLNVTIPPGTSSGKKLRLRGKGWQGQGDLYAVVQIVVPAADAVDAKARAALEEFAKRAPVKARK